MKDTFRQSMAWLHTWTGISLGWLLYFIFVTGSIGYFAVEIDQWMTPERSLNGPGASAAESVAVAQEYLQETVPSSGRWNIDPPGIRENPDLEIAWQDSNGSRQNRLLAPDTGDPVEYRDTGGGMTLYRMHYQLHYLPRTTAFWIVGIASMAMLVTLIAGIVIHRRIIRDLFTFRTGKGQRSWLDAHNLFSVLPLPFHLMITWSGLVFLGFTYMSVIISAGYGAESAPQQTFFSERFPGVFHAEAHDQPADLIEIKGLVHRAETKWGDRSVRHVTIQNPGDSGARIGIARDNHTVFRSSEQLVFDGVTGELLEHYEPPLGSAGVVRDSLLGLHEGRFADAPLRWLYFLSGLAGAAMIATGLVLWSVKRRLARETRPDSTMGPALVERLNVAVIVGLLVAILAYFLANRLLPVHLENRSDWEVHAMFITWAALILHSLARPARRLWREQLALLVLVALALPVVNLLVTDRHLGVTLTQASWVMAGTDLAALTVAGLAVYAWYRVGNVRAGSENTNMGHASRASANEETSQ
ncbi:PepSY domain-containing protein [Thioalkalivibrio sp. ALJ15]|uniref:PepSY-associated TM helix domain-containing protein n=1 Tax=Thioalkalivibrio sp. ALJ15 TaxID=748652 RepID=UPI00038024F7|nr:PepSY-associated TM helix domain-containing protein [Thioalkalivibrio sp. ALJ15]